jgi:serine/threonine protein kinase/Flp pilus assembly protein TadD
MDSDGSSSESLIGRRLLNYQVIEKLGAGGMGEVYLAEDLRLGRRVAVKRVHYKAGDPDGRMLMLEARAVARLNHPGIAMIYDVFEVDNRGHIVMEFVSGESLARRLGTKLPFDTLFDLGQQIADALAHAHEKGIIHRDLKPENIHVSSSGKVKLLDFGIAKVQAMPSFSADTTAAATNPGVLVGTPAYMSPEQLLQKPVDARTDIYGLCTLLFELATGARPFSGTGFMELAAAIITKPAPALKALRPDLPDRFCNLIARGLAKSPADRQHSMAAFCEELRGVKDGRVPSAESAQPPAVVAILPFRNTTGDPANDFIGMGICEMLISDIARLPALTVLSRSSVLQHNAAERDLRRISQELGATSVVDGSYQRLGDRLRLTISVVDPRSDQILWSDHLDGVVAGIFELQTMLSDKLTAAIRPGTGDVHRTTERFPTYNVQAFSDYARARVLLERQDIPGNLTRAVDLLEHCLKDDPKFALAHAALGEAYWNRFRQENDSHWTVKALSALTEAMRLDPEQPDIRRALARIYRGTGRNQEALRELEAARIAQPQSDETYRNLGEVLFALGRKNEAIESYEQAIRLRPGFWENHRFIGAAWYRMGHYDRAIVAFSRVVDLQPDNAWGFQMLGTAYHAAGDVEHARSNYERAMNITPTATAAANLGTIYYARGAYSEALRCYDQAIELVPHNGGYFRNKGDACAKLGDMDKARACYERAAELTQELIRVNPKDAEALSRLAVYEAKLHRFEDAFRHTAEASAFEPLAVEVAYRRGVVFALSGKLEEAAASVKLAIERGFSLTIVKEDDDLQELRKSQAYGSIISSGSST